MTASELNILNYLLFGTTVTVLLYLLWRKSKQAPVVFNWAGGLLYGLPFFPSAILLFSFLFLGVSVFRPDLDLLQPAMFFSFNALILFAAGWQGVHQSVTHTHLVLDPWFPARDIPLKDIVDYYFKTHGFITKVTILYKRNGKTHRTTFTMPARYTKLFDQVVDQRISNPSKSPYKATLITR